MRGLWLLLHLVGVVVWVGGMFFAHHCMRPVIVLRCEPPQRLRLLSEILGKFFNYVSLSLVLIWISGIALLHGASGKMPLSSMIMFSIAIVMTLLFVIIKWARFPLLEAAVVKGDWSAGAAAMNSIRKLVAANLGLGFLVILVATVGPYWLKF